MQMRLIIKFLCAALLSATRTVEVNAVFCSVNVTGRPSEVVAINHVSIDCFPEGVEELSEAPITLDDSLNISNSSYRWRGRTYTPAFQSQARHLVSISPPSGTQLTLGNSRLSGVNMSSGASIIMLNDITQVTIEDLSAFECTCAAILQSNNNAAGGLVQLKSSQLSQSVGTGISISNQSLTVQDTSFSSLNGSAINHDNEGDSKLDLMSSNFTSMQGQSSNIILVTRADVLVSDCHFDNNSAISVLAVEPKSSSVTSAYANETVTVVGSTFFNNSASRSVMYMEGFGGDLNQVMHLYNSNFTNNTAQQLGAAVTAVSVRNVTVQGCVFINNTAELGLGALYVYGSSAQVTLLLVYDSQFISNNATSNDSDPDNIDMFDISSRVSGAGLYASKCQCVGVNNSTFTDNLGIGMSVLGQGSTLGKCGQSDSVLFNLSSSSHNPDDIKDFSDFLGGAGENRTDIGLDVRSSTFSKNRAVKGADVGSATDYAKGGAGLYVSSIELSFLTRCKFEDNVGAQGAGLSLEACFVSIMWNCDFYGNAAQQGGAVATTGSRSGLLITYSRFYYNLAEHGGAIYGEAGARIDVRRSSTISNNIAGTNGAGIACVGCLEIIFYDTTFDSNNASGEGGACYCADCNKVRADYAYFTNNRADKGGAFSLLGTQSYDREGSFTYNEFSGNNVSADGGALNLVGAHNWLNANTFANNSALNSGGAVMYTQESLQTQRLQAPENGPWVWLTTVGAVRSDLFSDQNNFTGNQANTSGAVIYSTDLDSTWLKCQNGSESSKVTCPEWDEGYPNLLSDGALGYQYGPGIAYPPKTVMSDMLADQHLEIISNGKSPLPMPRIWVVDQVGQSVSMPSLEANVTVVSLDPLLLADGIQNATLLNQVQATADANGSIIFNGTVLLAAPAIYNLTISVAEATPLTIVVQVRNCTKGQFSFSPEQCSFCSPGTYNMNAGGNCTACPEGAQCFGGATLVPQNQSWHSAPESDHMVACPNNNACLRNITALKICQNAAYSLQLARNLSQPLPAEAPTCDLDADVNSPLPSAYPTQLCAPGYYGPVCSLCVRTEQRSSSYGRTGPLKCRVCRHPAIIMLAYIASTLVVLAWLSYVIHITLTDNVEAANGTLDPGRTSQLIRAFNLWLQYMSLLGLVNIPTPRTMQVLFNAANLAFTTVSSGILSLDCLLTGSVNRAVQSLLIHLALPLLMLLLLSAIQLLWWRRARKAFTDPSAGSSAVALSVMLNQPRSAELKRRLLITFLEVTFFYYPSLLTATLQIFACFRIDPANSGYALDWPHGYWVPDMSQPCYEGWHKLLAWLVGGPMMLVLALLIPLLPAFLLWRSRGKLDEPAVQLQLGYLYQFYTPRLRFWNTVVLYFTLCLAAAQVFATAINAYFQLTIMLMVLVIDITALAQLQPFKDGLMQRMQVFGKFTVVATATGCLYFMDVSKAASTAGLEAVGVLLLLLNLLYIVATAFLVTKTGAKKARQLLHSVSSKAPAAAKSLLSPLSFGLQRLSSLPMVPAFLRRDAGTSADEDTTLPNSVVTDSAASSFSNSWLHRRTRPATAGRQSSSQMSLLSSTDAVGSPEQSPEAAQASVLRALRHEQQL